METPDSTDAVVVDVVNAGGCGWHARVWADNVPECVWPSFTSEVMAVRMAVAYGTGVLRGRGKGTLGKVRVTREFFREPFEDWMDQP